MPKNILAVFLCLSQRYRGKAQVKMCSLIPLPVIVHVGCLCVMWLAVCGHMFSNQSVLVWWDARQSLAGLYLKLLPVNYGRLLGLRKAAFQCYFGFHLGGTLKKDGLWTWAGHTCLCDQKSLLEITVQQGILEESLMCCITCHDQSVTSQTLTNQMTNSHDHYWQKCQNSHICLPW